MLRSIPRFRHPTALCCALILVHGVLLAAAALENSATFDEPAHLAAGVEYWRHGDFSIYSLTPPLLRLWAALPAVAAGAVAPDPTNARSHPLKERHWVYAFDFLAANGTRFEWLLKVARLGMIPISCFAAWLVWRWARELYGDGAGTAACTMYCLNPSILASGSLITVDVGTTAAILASSYLWWRFCRTPRASLWVLACMAVVAAHLCKFTAVLLWPMLLAISISSMAQTSGRNGWRSVPWLICLGIATAFALNAIYGFQGTLRPLRDFHFDSNLMVAVRRKLPNLPSPAPRLIIEGFDAQKSDSQGGGYQGFLFGQIYAGARWSYYPLALLCKLPVSMIVLFALAVLSPLVNLVKRAKSKATAPDDRNERGLFLAALIFAAGIVFIGDLNIGTRYLLPIFPFVFIFIARLWRHFESHSQARARFRNAMLVFLTAETLLVCPYFLSYINLAAGGTSNGWRLLSDSDFDWGQGLIALRQWMRANQVPHITQAYFGLVDPAVYSIESTPIIDQSDDTYVAISSYYLNGLANRLVLRGGERAIIHLTYAPALRQMKPVAVVGDTIFIYYRRDIARAIVQSIPSPSPLSGGF